MEGQPQQGGQVQHLQMPGQPGRAQGETVPGAHRIGKALAPCTSCQGVGFLPSELWESVQSRERHGGCPGIHRDLHFEMITWAGMEQGRGKERKQGGQPGAVVGEGVQNTPLWHENDFELKAFEKGFFFGSSVSA